MKNIKIGDHGPEVIDLQNQLIKLLYPLTPDGDFGPKTLGAVSIFQVRNNLPSGGSVNDSTYDAIMKDIAYNNNVDKPTYDKITGLHPKIRAEVFHLTKQCYRSNVRIRIAQGYRTIAEQDALYAQGRTQPGSIVTFSKGGQSYHNYGLAIDFCLLHTNGSISWNMTEDINKDGIPDWVQVVKIFTANGYDWGGSWPKPKTDTPHFEKKFGNNTSALLALHDSGKVDANGYVLI